MTYHVQFPGLGLEFTLDRVAFTVFGMPIYWYGILIATGLALAIVFAFSHARRFGIDSDRMVDVILIGTVCAVIGGRAFYVATAPFEYASFAEMLDIRLGGVAIYGAVIAAFLSGYFACRWRKVPILPMFDLAGMGFLLGQGIGRWGNFVNQEAFGTNTTLPWGMYSEGTCNYLSSVQETLAAQGVAVDPSLPVHPTFLYESIWCLLGFFLGYWAGRLLKLDFPTVQTVALNAGMRNISAGAVLAEAYFPGDVLFPVAFSPVFLQATTALIVKALRATRPGRADQAAYEARLAEEPSR